MSRMLEALKQIEKRAPARLTRETMRSRNATIEPHPAPPTLALPVSTVGPVSAWPSGVVEPSISLSPLGAAEPVVIVPRPVATRVVEGYYVHLRDTLLAQNPTQSPLALLFARVGDVADASVVVAELAVALASRASGEILAIDADLTEPGGSEGTLGFRDVLAGRIEWQECMTATATPRVRFMSAGAAALSEAVKDDNCKNTLGQLRAHFAHVLLDGGDVEGPHIPNLSRLVHSTYLLVELGGTGRHAAQAAVRHIRRRGGKLGGCILTNAESHEVVAQLR